MYMYHLYARTHTHTHTQRERRTHTHTETQTHTHTERERGREMHTKPGAVGPALPCGPALVGVEGPDELVAPGVLHGEGDNYHVKGVEDTYHGMKAR
jgi:hypothetical protein